MRVERREVFFDTESLVSKVESKEFFSAGK